MKITSESSSDDEPRLMDTHNKLHCETLISRY